MNDLNTQRLTSQPPAPFRDFESYLEYRAGQVRWSDERREKSLNHSVSYVQMYLKSMMLLNGGAVVAIPTFAKALSAEPMPGRLLWSISCFVLGLILASVAAGLLGLAFVQFQNAYRAAAARSGASVDAQYRASQAKQPIPPRNNTPTDKEAAARRVATRFNKIALWSGCGTLIAFIAGSVLAVWQMY